MILVTVFYKRLLPIFGVPATCVPLTIALFLQL